MYAKGLARSRRASLNEPGRGGRRRRASLPGQAAELSGQRPLQTQSGRTGGQAPRSLKGETRESVGPPNGHGPAAGHSVSPGPG